MITHGARRSQNKPSFREAFKRRRAIIPADGIYEWQRTEDRKQPYFIRMRDGGLFGFAGLWDRWSNGEGEIIESCSILTTEANEVFRSVHGVCRSRSILSLRRVAGHGRARR